MSMGPPPGQQQFNSGPPPGDFYSSNMGPPPNQQFNSGPPPGGNFYSSNMGPPPGQPQYNSPGMGPAPGHGHGGPGPMGPPQMLNGPEVRGSNAHTINTGGKKRALVIGINYVLCSKGRLNGCINDARNISAFVRQHFGFQEMRVMTDDTPPNSPDHPTKQNLLQAIRWLVADARPGDSFFFHFSGHGGQSEDKTGMEDDGLNETILPADFQQAGMIVDDDLHNMLVRNLPEGCRFTAIFDSCHSGTALDLPYIYKVREGQFANVHKSKDDTLVNRHKKKFKASNLTSLSGATKMIASHVTSEVSHQTKKKSLQARLERNNTTKAVVVMISGCRDDQTSADTTVANQATGAMSYSFMETLKKHQTAISYANLLHGMREVLHNGPKQYTQFPQLSYGRPMDMNEIFTM